MEKTVKSIGLNMGLYLGLGLTLLTVILYAVNMDMFVKWWYGIGLFVIINVVGFMAASKAKKAMGGFISFKDAFTAFFLTILVATLISTVVGFVIFNVVDPEAAQQLNEKILLAQKQMMERFGAPEETIKQALAEAQKKDNFAVGTQVTNFFIGLLVYAIIGLIGAAIIKKKNPDQA